MYHSVPWFCVYQAREMQIQSLTNLSLYITMKKQRVCGFVSTVICDCFYMTELCSSLKESDFLYYHIPEFHTEF